MARALLTDPADADDRERLAGELLAAIALPALRLLVSLHPYVVLREHEHRHQAEVGERARVDAARGRERDVRLVETDALHHLADARARGLQPAETRRDGGEVADVPGRKIEDDLGATKHLEEPRLLFRRALQGRAGVVRDVARPRQQSGIVEDFDPRIDRADSVDVLGLERRRDQHHERLGHQALPPRSRVRVNALIRSTISGSGSRISLGWLEWRATEGAWFCAPAHPSSAGAPRTS